MARRKPLQEQVDELRTEVNRLRAELASFKKRGEPVPGPGAPSRHKIGPYPVSVLKRYFPETEGLTNKTAQDKLKKAFGISVAKDKKGLMVEQWLCERYRIPKPLPRLYGFKALDAKGSVSPKDVKD